jgi:hypothetical protein
MSEDKISQEEEIRRQLEKLDPVERFHYFSSLREQGIDPKEVGIVPGNPVTKKVKSGADMADKLVKRVSVAGDDWLNGVKNPSRNPVEAALAAKDKFVDRLTAAIKEGRWEGGLKKVTAADIAAVASALGPGVYTTGVDARKAKIGKVFNELAPMFQDVSNAIQTMSDKTDADREKRLLAARKLMLEVGKKRKGTA